MIPVIYMLYPRPVGLSRRRKRRARSPCGDGDRKAILDNVLKLLDGQA